MQGWCAWYESIGGMAACAVPPLFHPANGVRSL
jgi:hypothetical protein